MLVVLAIWCSTSTPLTPVRTACRGRSTSSRPTTACRRSWEQFSSPTSCQGDNLDKAQIQAAAAQLREIANKSDQFNEPITIDASPDGKVAVIEVLLAGSGSDDTSLNAVKTLRNDVVPEVLPTVNGGELVGVSGFSAGSLGLQRADARASGTCSPSSSRWRSC